MNGGQDCLTFRVMHIWVSSISEQSQCHQCSARNMIHRVPQPRGKAWVSVVGDNSKVRQSPVVTFRSIPCTVLAGSTSSYVRSYCTDISSLELLTSHRPLRYSDTLQLVGAFLLGAYSSSYNSLTVYGALPASGLQVPRNVPKRIGSLYDRPLLRERHVKHLLRLYPEKIVRQK